MTTHPRQRSAELIADAVTIGDQSPDLSQVVRAQLWQGLVALYSAEVRAEGHDNAILAGLRMLEDLPRRVEAAILQARPRPPARPDSAPSWDCAELPRPPAQPFVATPGGLELAPRGELIELIPGDGYIGLRR